MFSITALTAFSRWHRADLLNFDGYDDYAVILGNLIFHQFSDVQLAALGLKLRRSARLILACEPLRRRSSQILFAAVAPLLGANHVSLHDAHVSVGAGFRGAELPHLLGLPVHEGSIFARRHEPQVAQRAHHLVIAEQQMNHTTSRRRFILETPQQIERLA